MFKLKALAKEKILKETPLPILTFSPQNELWDYNRQAEIIFQVTSSSLGKSLNDFSNDWNFTINPGEYIREGRVYLIQEYRLSLQPDSDPARIFTFSDITEIRDLSLELTSQNKTLQHLNQELGRALDFNQQIYSILSHDLSGSLHSVNLLMSGMLQTAKKSGNEEIQSQLDVALRSQQTSLDLLADLLKWNLAQGNSLSQTALRTPSECLTRVIMHLTAQIESRKVTISIDDQFQQFDHQIDSYSFETILRNIVSNAIRYSHVGGKVDISLKSGDKGLRVEVQDRGQGISPNSKKAEEGFGLGLVFTHRYIKALGGELKTFSQATRGTLVVIELPLLAQEVIV
jgi:signal transduction histidine kinase